MKIRIHFLWLLCIFFPFCAGTPMFQNQEPYRELHAYENVKVNHLWKCAWEALGNLEFRIDRSDQKSGLLRASWREEKGIYGENIGDEGSVPKRLFSPRSTVFIIQISGSGEKALLLCEVTTAGGPHTVDRSRKNKDEAKIFFSEVEKLLIKK